jgi:hypothetical protein
VVASMDSVQLAGDQVAEGFVRAWVPWRKVSGQSALLAWGRAPRVRPPGCSDDTATAVRLGFRAEMERHCMLATDTLATD